MTAKILSLGELKQLDVVPTTPFQFVMPGRETLVCEAVYRHLPGKQLVFFAHWGGADARVKLFFQRKHFEQERAGIQVLRAAGVAGPKELWSLVDEGAGYFLATEFLTEAISLQDRYRQLPVKELVSELRGVLALMGQLHRAGWMQADINLDSFLIRRGIIYAIEGDGIEPLGSRLNNLALFFAQMIPDYDALVSASIDAYGRLAPTVKQLLAAIIEQRELRIKNYLTKSLQSCSQFRLITTPAASTVFRRHYENKRLHEVMAQPEVAIGRGQFLKRGNTATVVKVSGNGGDWIIKRYNIKSFWHGVNRWFRPSRASISWQSAHRLELLGIATPHVLAMRENRSGPLRQEAYLVSRCAEGCNLQAWLLKQNHAEIPTWLDQQVVRLFDIFWTAKVSHGDMKATNLIVSNKELQVIDLDTVKWHGTEKYFLRAFRHDLQRFMANWQGDAWVHFSQLLSSLAQRAEIKFIK